MDNLHLHKVREVKHIPHEMLIKTKLWNAMCEVGATGNSAVVNSTVMIQRLERSLFLGPECVPGIRGWECN